MAFLSVSILSPICAVADIAVDDNIEILDARMVTGVDENLIPIKPTDVFPKGISKVFCWFRWQHAKINTQIIARWHYITDDVHILDYPFLIPKKEGAGSISLTMPAGKSLPVGSYLLDLIVGEYTLVTLVFSVE